MPRRARPGLDGIVAASIAEFFEVGYGGTTVRMIANRAEVTVAALYHHFRSKHEILVTIMRSVMATMAEGTQKNLALAGDDPLLQFAGFIDNHIQFHIRHRREAFVANSELRSLEANSRSEIVAMRDEYEATLKSIIARGAAKGDFSVPDARLASRAIIAMSSAVSSWFDPAGPLSAVEVKEDYYRLAANMLRCSLPLPRWLDASGASGD